MEKKKRVKLYMNEGLQELLEERMILESNLSEGILLGEENESKICDPETGFFTTCYQPGNVTFWIVYQPYEDGYYIKNAYSHRMTFKST